VLEMGGTVLLFPWVGTSTVAAMCVALQGIGIKSEDNGLGITAVGTADEVTDTLRKLASFTKDDLAEVVNGVVALGTAKYDEFVPETLLQRFWARRNAAAIEQIPQIASELLTPASPG